MGQKGPRDLEEGPSLATAGHSDNRPLRADSKQAARTTWAVGRRPAQPRPQAAALSLTAPPVVPVSSP